MSADSMWRFGPFRLDPIDMCLWRDTEILPLRPKPFAVLAYLVAHAGQVVHKDTLLEEVWPEAVVSEGVLKDYINQIRKTLSDTARAPQYIATVHRQGQLDRAIPLLERGLSLCREADLPLAFPTVASYLGTAYAQAGRIEEALPLLEQALAQGALIQLGDRQTLCMVLLGSGYLRAGRLQDTLSLAQEALALARERQERGVEAYALHLLGALAAAGTAPDMAQAETCYQQARTLAHHLSMRPMLAHTTLGLGALYQQTGQWVQAHTTLSAAIALFDAMGMTFWRTQAHATLSQMIVS